LKDARALSLNTVPGAAAARESRTADEALVRAALAGDMSGFEQLVGRYKKQIVNFIYRMIGDYDTALDMSQDVFIRVYQALDRYDPRYQFTTWIYRIASNCAIDRLRRHTPPTVSLDATPPSAEGVRRLQIASTDQNPAESYESRDTMRRLDAAIRRLPPGYRRLIVLRHVNQLRYEQIAAVTRLPLGTVKNRIFRARTILRRDIERPEPARRRGAQEETAP
jgi:RNA polymerase sigma-70 factor (ECF subfamily)